MKTLSNALSGVNVIINDDELVELRDNCGESQTADLWSSHTSFFLLLCTIRIQHCITFF